MYELLSGYTRNSMLYITSEPFVLKHNGSFDYVRLLHDNPALPDQYNQVRQPYH